MGKNAPTESDFKIMETSGDIPAENKKWMELVKEYEHFLTNNFEHWFFGKMTKEQTGYFAYKHADHHLRQFNY